MYYVNASVLYMEPVTISSAVRHALHMIYRDHEKVFGTTPLIHSPAYNHKLESAMKNSQSDDIQAIRIQYSSNSDDPHEEEAYVHCMKENGILEIIGSDDLGLIYGLLHYSHAYLGVDPFWFWAELSPAAQTRVRVPNLPIYSSQPSVRYRGWFVNDEVCLIGWTDQYPPGKEVWQPVFEALLRCGGNMIIPGTDLPREGIHHTLAAEMGLWITHHHAEPLGAEMFLRAYSGITASYQQHPEKYERLWQQAIEKQKNDKIVWVLSFRGQGDQPFWENDPAFDTPQKQGKLISIVLKRQYDMISEAVPHPVCCTALYGEIAELYQNGHIEIPEGVIKVWADNGYGKMVSRRHGNHNERIRALPKAGDLGLHGIYYHVTFHDLQASNHLTLLPSSSEWVSRQLEEVLDVGASAYWLVNSGNVLQHLPLLDLIAAMWMDGKVDASNHRQVFIARMYPETNNSTRARIVNLYKQYANCTIAYGLHEDERAGEEFYHHTARQLIGQWLKGDQSSHSRLQWLTGQIPFPAQVKKVGGLAAAALSDWENLLSEAEAIYDVLNAEEGERLYRQFIVQVRLHTMGCRGLAYLRQAYCAFRKQEYARAFVEVSLSLQAWNSSQHALDQAAQGNWQNFYRADWLTNVRNTIEHTETLRRYLRILGDGPDLFAWYKEYLMPETEKHIYLENTHRNPLSDEELARQLREHFQIEKEQASVR